MTKFHRGILINKIPVSTIPGLIFAAGVVAIVLIGLPTLIVPFLACIVLGVALAFVRRWWLNRT
ncbi:MAG TPA: hypothetical protein VLU25_20360 [Acidobacteriota bacterium]|nr:hypothetical protein [Acidobacteriota bacterium]